MRVCYEELDSVDDLWTLCQGVGEWIEVSYNFKYGWLDGDYDAIVSEILSRFSKTEGRLEASFEGRSKAEKKLQYELGVTWDLLHLSARRHLITAEVKQATLKDPDQPLWDFIDKYRPALEAMLGNRFGVRLDAYIDGTDNELAKRFKKDYLGGGRWKASGLNLGQWSRALGDSRTRELLSAAGLGHKPVPSGLARELKRLAELLDPAHHNTDEEITAEEVEKVRRDTFEVLKVLARIR